MNPSEAAVLLSKVSANDNREVTESAARAWSEALFDVDLRDALEYLPRYYREATRDGKNWVYPGDVLTGVQELFKERRQTVAGEAREAAVRGLSEDDQDVIDKGGVGMVGNRAYSQAYREFDLQHPMPGRDVLDRREFSEQERANNPAAFYKALAPRAAS